MATINYRTFDLSLFYTSCYYFKSLSNYILKRFDLKKDDLIIDIGSNDGSFLNYFKKKDIKVLGIDPSNNVAKVANKKGIKTIVNFFNSEIAEKIKNKYKKAKIVTVFNTFAHVENMRDMLKGINNILDENGILIFECQYLGDIYKKKILGTFFHEHMYHHSVTSLNNLFNSMNLTLFDVIKVNVQKGSIVGFVSKKNKFKISKRVKNLIKKEKIKGDINFSSLVKFSDFVLLQREKSKKIIRKFNSKKIAAFGSARSGPTLVNNFGISKFLNYILDDHHLKVCRYTSLNGLIVKPTKDLLKLMPVVCIILAYLHLKKIIKNNKRYLLSGGNFLSLYPKPTLINLKNYKRFI